MTSETIRKRKEYLEKGKQWDFAISLATIEGGQPSDFLLKLIEKEKRGEITVDDVENELIAKIRREQNQAVAS